MDKVKLNIKKDSLYINGSNSVIGTIYFDLDGYFFPSDDWYDFVVALLGWLAKITANLTKSEAKTVEMSFMEGPFKIALAVKEDYQCKIDCIEGEELAGDEEIIHKTITVPLDEVINEILKGCELIIQMKESKELEFDKDFEYLKESYNLLRDGKEWWGWLCS